MLSNFLSVLALEHLKTTLFYYRLENIWSLKARFRGLPKTLIREERRSGRLSIQKFLFVGRLAL